MARSDPAITRRDKRFQSTIDFSQELHAKLSNPQSSSANGLLLADINSQIRVVTGFNPSHLNGILRSTAKEFERVGKELWNLCIRLRREAAVSDPNSQLLLRSRVFAFHVLEMGRGAGRRKADAGSEAVYLMGLALTLARLCLDGGDSESARGAMYKAAEYVERLDHQDTEDAHDSMRTKLEADYFAMRMALAWKENRLDVAEHMYSKAEGLRGRLDVTSAEMMADTLHHIGAGLQRKGDFPMAIKWLQRSSKTTNLHSLDRLSAEGLDTRLSTYNSLVQAYLGSSSVEEADELISYVESEIGDKMVVLHWKLQVLQKSPAELISAEVYASILRRMVRVFDFSDNNFQFLIHHVKELRCRNSGLARAVLDELLTQRVLELENRSWLDRSLVTRVWMSTVEPSSTDSTNITDLSNILGVVQQALSEPLGSDATGASQSLLWKRAESAMATQQFEEADEWCSVALHPLFEKSSQANQAKFGRKRIMCALGLNRPEKARELFEGMTEAIQNDCLTRFLIFRAALLDWDYALGQKCIEYLSQFADKNHVQEMLYACIRESQKVGDKLCTLTALKAVAENWSTENSMGSNLPSILRCTIRLVSMVGEQGKDEIQAGESDILIDDVCSIFEIGARHAMLQPVDQDGKKIFSTNELQWFRKNAYNMGAMKCHLWELPQILRIFGACLTFISCYPPDISTPERQDLALMSMRCHFVLAAAMVSLARAEDHIEERKQRYLEVRSHVAAFDLQLGTEVNSQDENIIKDLRHKMATLFVFDFEAAVALESWDNLGVVVRKAEFCRDETMLKAMGDCLLRSEPPGNVMFSTMRLIINEIYSLEGFDIERLAKYLRCIFHATLPLDESLALQLTDETLRIARQGRKVYSPFPSTELEWLIATIFNHAIDFYARSEEELCHRWGLRAIELSEFMDDNGHLRDMLQHKFSKLPFQGKSKD